MYLVSPYGGLLHIIVGELSTFPTNTTNVEMTLGRCWLSLAVTCLNLYPTYTQQTRDVDLRLC